MSHARPPTPVPVGNAEIRTILQRFSESERNALNRLIPVFYERLREIAHYRLQAAPGERSLNTTGLVHEAYLRLAQSPQAAFLSHSHFLSVASRIMRNVLVDQARARGAQKRGAGMDTLPLQEEMWVSQIDLDGALELDEALKKLEAIDARQSEIVEHRYFGGLSLEETASVLNLSLATVKRELRLARAWLAAELNRESA